MNDLDLGPCCHCGRLRASNIVMLGRRLPYSYCGRGYGWGCLVCGLPADGVVSMLCDACVEECNPPRYARLGGQGIASGRLVALHTFAVVPFNHNLAKHPEVFPANNPAAEHLVWFDDSPDAGPDCLCSYCGRPILHEVPFRMFYGGAGKEARLHSGCVEEADEYG